MKGIQEGLREGLKGKKAIITGGSRGIGRAIARDFFNLGLDICVVSGSGVGFEGLLEGVSGSGEVMMEKGDVKDEGQVKGVIEKVIGKWGKVDILVNNAGIARDNLSVRMGMEDWDEVMGVNLRGCFLYTRGVLRGMIRRRWGRVINISSVVGGVGNVGQSNYAASKAGMIGLTKSIALEVGSRNITVNAISPGFIETRMALGLRDERKEEIKSRIPLGRFGEVWEVSGLVMYLSSHLGGYITGQVFVVDGGLTMMG